MFKKLLAAVMTLALLPAVCAYAVTYDESPDGEDVPVSVFEEAASPVDSADIVISAPSAILMEKETGTVIYEKNADELCEPASVTKIMTILLIAEAVDSGLITLDDTVTTSAYAASMGGSQVFLEENETMSVHEMLKCIVVSSANDAAVAMAEHIAGSEQAFVAMMNQRAEELGMKNTHFGNCTGLLKDAAHLTTARDIALMSRELIKHSWIREYTTIWMDTIRNGEFGLSNTNKLIYYYSGATGLKTGFTSSAGYCLSATAERDGVEYIAVVLHCDSSADRFESAKVLLSYAFSNYTLVSTLPEENIAPVPVALGKADYVSTEVSGGSNILVKKSSISSIERSVELLEGVTAPVTQGQKLGTLTVSLNGEVIGESDILASTDVPRLTVWDIFKSIVSIAFTGE